MLQGAFFSIPFTLRIYGMLLWEYYFSLKFTLILIILNIAIRQKSQILIFGKKIILAHIHLASNSNYHAPKQVLDLFNKKIVQIFWRRTNAHFADTSFPLVSFLMMPELLWLLFFLKFLGFLWHLTWKIFALGIETCSSHKEIKKVLK